MYYVKMTLPSLLLTPCHYHFQELDVKDIIL